MVFVLFHQRLCGPLANSLFNHRPNPHFQPDSKLEAAAHKADDSIQKVIELLEVAQLCCTALVDDLERKNLVRRVVGASCSLDSRRCDCREARV